MKHFKYKGSYQKGGFQIIATVVENVKLSTEGKNRKAKQVFNCAVGFVRLHQGLFFP